MRKRTVFISFFTSCTQPCPSDLSAHTHPVCDVCACALAMSDVYAREITSGAFRRLRRLTPHSHGALASTPLVDFEWSDVKCCRTELWVRRVASLALLAAEVENFSTFQLFKRQRRRQPIRSPHANTQSRSCNTREVCDWLL